MHGITDYDLQYAPFDVFVFHFSRTPVSTMDGMQYMYTVQCPTAGTLNVHCMPTALRIKDTVFLPLVIHPQNIRLLQGPFYHKSLLLIRLLQ